MGHRLAQALRGGVVSVLLLACSACSASTEVMDARPVRCTAGSSIACACADGRAGMQRCGVDGTYAACQCGDTDAGVDADDVVTPTDSGVDVVQPFDVGVDVASVDGSRDVATDGPVGDAPPDGPVRTDAGWQVFGGGLAPGGVVAPSTGTGFAVRAQGFTTGNVTCAGSFCIAGGIVP